MDARVGLSLVYLKQARLDEVQNEKILQQHATGNVSGLTAKQVKKLDNIEKSLKELKEAYSLDCNNPQVLVLLANFVGFSYKSPDFGLQMAGTAYEYCQEFTKLLKKHIDKDCIDSGLDNKFLLMYDHLNNENRLFLDNTGNENLNKRDQCLARMVHPLAQCQAEACYVIAKLFHIHDDYDNAIIWYYKSVALSPEFELALFGLAQMYYHRSM